MEGVDKAFLIPTKILNRKDLKPDVTEELYGGSKLI